MMDIMMMMETAKVGSLSDEFQRCHSTIRKCTRKSIFSSLLVPVFSFIFGVQTRWKSGTTLAGLTKMDKSSQRRMMTSCLIFKCTHATTNECCYKWDILLKKSRI
jgi:hypothetical protein